jgi:hypothetical protein
MPVILGSKRIRNEVRQWLALAEDVRDFALSIVDAITGNSPERAREILETRIREQAAGRAAAEASRLAGPRNNHGRTVQP